MNIISLLLIHTNGSIVCCRGGAKGTSVFRFQIIEIKEVGHFIELSKRSAFKKDISKRVIGSSLFRGNTAGDKEFTL